MAGEGVVAREEVAVARAGAAATLQAAQAIADHCSIQSAMSIVSVPDRTPYVASCMHIYSVTCHAITIIPEICRLSASHSIDA